MKELETYTIEDIFKKGLHEFLVNCRSNLNQISNQIEMLAILKKLFSKSDKSKKIHKKLNLTGQKILHKTYNKINLIIRNEI